MKKNNTTYLLQEFAQKVGVCKDTVRNYVKRGVLPDRRNPVNNFRVFTDEDVKVIKELLQGVVIKQRK